MTPDRGSVYRYHPLRELEGGYLPTFGDAPKTNCRVSVSPALARPPTYLSEGLVSAPPTPAFYKPLRVEAHHGGALNILFGPARACREPERRAEQNPRRHGRRAAADRGNKASSMKKARRARGDTHHDVTFREVS